MATVFRMVSASIIALGAALGACTAGAPASQSFAFGPFDVTAHQEIVNRCVQVTLHNDATLYVQSVELTTGPGFHHSNWLFVPETQYPGDDGAFDCADRAYNEAIAAAFGGVLFAQSTQSPHEVQAFPAGVAVAIPAHSKLIAQIHLLNAADSAIHIAPTIALTPIAQADVATVLSAISFEDHALGLPALKDSQFTVDCNLAQLHNQKFSRNPDFKIYYALAHYHALGTGLRLEAVKADGTATTVYSTAHRVGDSLGGPVDPTFDMTGYTRLRMTCDYTNPRSSVVGWGVGDQEMCVFLAFSDSPANWAGGAITADAPGDPMQLPGGVMSYSHACNVFALDAHH
jgi:hypothetical protein